MAPPDSGPQRPHHPRPECNTSGMPDVVAVVTRPLPRAALGALVLAATTACVSCGVSTPAAPSTAAGAPSTSAAPTRTASSPPPSAATSSASAAPTSAKSSAANRTSQPIAAAPICVTSQLLVSVGGGSGQGANVTHTAVNFVNNRSICTLTGFPGVSFVAGTDGHQVGATATRSGTPRAVTLARAGVAHADLSIVAAEAFPPPKCRATHADGLRIYPPNQKAFVVLRRGGMACSSAAVSPMGIGPVVSGAPINQH